MFWQNLEVLAQFFRIDDCASRALPPQCFYGRQSVAPRHSFHFLLQAALVFDLDSFGGQIPGEWLRAGCRRRRVRKEIRRQYARWQGAVTPCNFVKQVLHLLHRRQQGAPGCLLYRVPVQRADGRSVEIVEADIRAYHFRQFVASIVRFPLHADMAQESLRQSFRQHEPLPAKWQICDFFAEFDRAASRSHDLETAVQYERVIGQLATARGVWQ